MIFIRRDNDEINRKVQSMNILFISEDLVAGNVAYLLTKEGHKVKLYIKDSGRRENFKNMVPKTKHWGEELDWVGKDVGDILGCPKKDNIRAGSFGK